MSSTETYKSGRLDAVLLRILERFDAIQAIMLPSLGEVRRATYSPFLPFSPTSGRVLQAPTLERNVEKGTIVFADEDGTLTEVPVTGGHVKLQWRPDWAARWTPLEVDFEASGKDLIDSVRVSNRVVKALGGEPPEAFHFELFMDENNQKISKSKGNGLTMEEWLRYGTPQSLAYYMYQSPKSAKRLYFDVIPKATDEYLQQLDAFNRSRADGSNAPAIDNPAWHVHQGAPPERGSPVSFSLLLNLVSAADASTKDILWGFIERYIPGATAASEPVLDQLAGYAINYYEDFVKPSKTFRAPSDQERAAMQALAAKLKALPSRRRRRGHPERSVRGGQSGRLRAAPGLVLRALRSAAGPKPGSPLRLLRRNFRRRADRGPDRARPGRRTGRLGSIAARLEFVIPLFQAVTVGASHLTRV